MVPNAWSQFLRLEIAVSPLDFQRSAQHGLHSNHLAILGKSFVAQSPVLMLALSGVCRFQRDGQACFLWQMRERHAASERSGCLVIISA